MPLELIAFSGKIGKNQNNLTWQTASEQNINFFQIERSADGLNFETIGTTKSKGNARSLQNYAFTDAQPLSKSYYRLRSVENDGKEEFSKVITLINDPLTISVYPSRTSDLVQILLPPSVSKGEIEVFDLVGRSVAHEIMGTNEASISLAHLMSGIYMVSVRVNGVVHRVKVMKE